MLPYEEDLKSALTQLSETEDQIKELTDKKDQLRESIRTWMDMNKLTDFVTTDTANQNWNLSIVHQTRVSFNKDVIAAFLTPEQYEKAASQTEFDTLRCKKVTAKSKGKSNNLPKAPTENI